MAADGHEPACNPYAASSAWSINHRNSYASGASPFPAPHVGDQVGYQAIDLGTDSPIIIQFSEPYADGRRAVWFTIIGVPESRTVYKLDYDTGDVLAKASIRMRAGSPGRRARRASTTCSTATTT